MIDTDYIVSYRKTNKTVILPFREININIRNLVKNVYFKIRNKVVVYRIKPEE